MKPHIMEQNGNKKVRFQTNLLKKPVNGKILPNIGIIVQKIKTINEKFDTFLTGTNFEIRTATKNKINLKVTITSVAGAMFPIKIRVPRVNDVL